MSRSAPEKRLVVVGAGGHAKVVIEVLRAQGGYEIVGLLDPDPLAQQVLGVKVIGDDKILPALHSVGVDCCFVALGSNALRAKIGQQVCEMGFLLVTVVHPSAVVMPSADVREGVVIMPRAVVGAEATVEALTIVNTAAVIEHDCWIGAAAHLAPGATLAGAVRVGNRAFIGTGAAIRPGVIIGEDAIVGAGAAVVANVAAGSVVGGVPARELRRRTGDAP